MYRIFFCAAIAWMTGCERNGLSPVEIKVDDGAGHTTIGNVALAATHTVSNGETLFDVAYKYNIDPINLAKMNGIAAPYNVRDGQTLRLPEESTSNPQEIATASDVSQSHESYHQEKQAEKQTEKNELDDEFASLVSLKGKQSKDVTKDSPKASNSTSKTSKSKGTSFNEQEEFLSSPKVTKTAVGKSLNEESSGLEKVKEAPVVEKSKPAVASGKMIYPTNGKIVSRFGDVKDGISNDGINIKASAGSPVKATSGGDVIYAGNKLEEFGNTVIVQHDNGLITSYAHLKDISIKNGAKVKAGDVIGSVGKTGDVTEPQLHFEVLKNKTPVDPEKYLAR